MGICSFFLENIFPHSTIFTFLFNFIACWMCLIGNIIYRLIMSIWGRKKYKLTNPSRRASSFISKPATAEEANESQVGVSGDAMTLGRLSNLTQIQYRSSPDPPLVLPTGSTESNRQSRSLTNLSIEPVTSPPPLPPRRRVPPPPQRPPFLFRTTTGDHHHQLPPDSVLPVLERNAVVRSSRLMMNHPFVYFRFESGAQNIPGSEYNVVPLWINDDEQPPSYDEAMKLKPPSIADPPPPPSALPVQIERIQEPSPNLESSPQVEGGEKIEAEESPKQIRHFRRETSV